MFLENKVKKEYVQVYASFRDKDTQYIFNMKINEKKYNFHQNSKFKKNKDTAKYPAIIFLIILTGCFLSPSKIENMSSTILFDFTTEKC